MMLSWYLITNQTVIIHVSTLDFFFQWYIQATCAVQGHGLYEGLDWLSNELSKV